VTVRTLSAAAIASLTAENTDEIWLVLLEITHPSMVTPIRVVNDNQDCTSNGVLYQGLPFDLDLPGDSAEAPGFASIAIPNVDRAIVAAGRELSGPASCTITVVLASQPNVIEIQYPGLTMRELKWDASTVRGRLIFESIVTEPCTLTITPERFPGLFAALLSIGLTVSLAAPHLGA
jgi:hypothetical protein